MSSEKKIPFEKFQPKPGYTSVFSRNLIDKLLSPTEQGAYLHMTVGPRLWYGDVFPYSFDNDARRADFIAEFNERAADNPELRSPFTKIDANWQPVPIHKVPVVQTQLRKLSKDLGDAASWLEDNFRPDHEEDDARFAAYLRFAKGLLPEGQFNEVLKKCIQMPPNYPVSWTVCPIETHRDPLKQKASFEGWLTYPNEILTQKGNETMAMFGVAAWERYKSFPIDVKFLANYIYAKSGFLAEGDYSAFSIPNDPDVAQEAGSALVHLYVGRMDSKVKYSLNPKLKSLFGGGCNFTDAVRLVEGHEFSHTWRYPGEAKRLGRYHIIFREMWANSRALALATSSVFDDKFRESIVRGYLAYNVDDIGSFTDCLFSPRGEDQPSLDELMKSNNPNDTSADYRAAAYIPSRLAVLDNHLKRNQIVDPMGILKRAEKVDWELDALAKAGSEDDVRLYLNDLYDHKKVFNGISDSSEQVA